MLFVLVLEFFICWTPLYVINTVAMFIGPAIYEYVDYTTISFFQLLAYSSSCCNPITYCFMNASFRRAFVDTFRGIHFNGGTFWHKNSKAATNLSMAGNSIAMGNSCTVVTANTVLDSPRLWDPLMTMVGARKHNKRALLTFDKAEGTSVCLSGLLKVTFSHHFSWKLDLKSYVTSHLNQRI